MNEFIAAVLIAVNVCMWFASVERREQGRTVIVDGREVTLRI